MAVPPPRRRGGFPLMLLGVILALATAALVLFLTNSGGAALQSGTPVLVASHTLTAGAVLSATNGTPPYVRVADAFQVERMPASMVPVDAYTFTNQSDLATALNGQMILSSFLAGDILRRGDQRMSALGSAPARSLANHNPAALPDGSVLFTLHSGDAAGMQIGAQEGDHVDVLATMSNNAAKNSSPITQTTMQNLLIYAVPDAKTLIVVVSHEDALVLKALVESAKIDLVLRKPGDSDAANTQAVDPAWIMSHFGFTPPNGS